MSTPEGDDLLRMIRQFVKERGTPPSQIEMITELVARTVVTVMTEPRFYSHLLVVQNLQARVFELERVIALYGQQARQGSPAARPPSPKKAAKKLPAKKLAKKPPLPYNVRQFKKGASGR
jgi:hypothetical protein